MGSCLVLLSSYVSDGQPTPRNPNLEQESRVSESLVFLAPVLIPDSSVSTRALRVHEGMQAVDGMLKSGSLAPFVLSGALPVTPGEGYRREPSESPPHPETCRLSAAATTWWSKSRSDSDRRTTSSFPHVQHAHKLGALEPNRPNLCMSQLLLESHQTTWSPWLADL